MDATTEVSSLRLTVREEKLLKSSFKIYNNPPSGNDMAFNHSILCQVGLPRSKVLGNEFMRRSGDAWLNVQAGYLDLGKGPVLQSIPYGPMPRLALAWISTYAKRHKTREIPIGESASQFLQFIGMDSQGSRHSKLRQQMHALAACRMQLGFNGSTFNGQPVDQFDAWIPSATNLQRTLWSGRMILSEAYFLEVMENGVPLDYRALIALKGSALAIDVYSWLAHRLHRIEGRPVLVHWKSLRTQFADEYQGKDADKDFKKQFMKVLPSVLGVYPQANIKQVKGAIMLQKSLPPIPYKT
jgi:hypothetical protein